MEIVVRKDGMCTCHQHHKCVKDKVASQGRCTEEELKALGYRTLCVEDLCSYHKSIGEERGWKKGLKYGLFLAILTVVLFILMR